ncbi:MAG: 60S ribosomal subunit assembly export LOC1 [Lasallia pustulata]|uniref:60S ribosomal subunit assembly export LOC1 n=1 Tax=Lasallia pustulata TaxID=136370 RepID=A0A5M8PE96_9LECA|nr:MAG: 60S ribosomal subunit assembly export LOC1 [Lasallia pustulata]
MAPNRGPPKKTGSTKSTKGSKAPTRPGALGANTKNRVSKKPKAPPPKQQKTKSATGPQKKKRRVYTDKELGLPKLNMITPVGVEKPRGKKKGKVFVDDSESMMTILAIVNADKEGQIESKMMKSRQMEEIRDARKKEAEARQEQRKSKLEETKDSIRKKRKRRADDGGGQEAPESESKSPKGSKAARKRVSFA